MINNITPYININSVNKYDNTDKIEIDFNVSEDNPEIFLLTMIAFKNLYSYEIEDKGEGRWIGLLVELTEKITNFSYESDLYGDGLHRLTTEDIANNKALGITDDKTLLLWVKAEDITNSTILKLYKHTEEETPIEEEVPAETEEETPTTEGEGETPTEPVTPVEPVLVGTVLFTLEGTINPYLDDNFRKLKFNLQEQEFPYFSDNDLMYLLEEYEGVTEASYEGCLIKAQNDSIKLGPINTPSNEEYWLRRAEHFHLKLLAEQRLEAKRKNGNYGSCIVFKRSDGR